MSLPSTPSVCVVTVTYGQRHKLLIRVVDTLARLQDGDSIRQIFVVDNGSTPISASFLQELACRNPLVVVLQSPNNEGSASGFARGLRAAHSSGCEFVWLLDDDNAPEADALAALLRARTRGGDQAAYLALRSDRAPYVEYAEGRAPVDILGRRNSFLNFSYRDLPRKVARLLSRGPKASEAVTAPSWLLPVPYGPYGGLFFPIRHLDTIGYPATDFYLYADDIEFTHRFARASIPLYLVSASRIADLETSWHVSAKRRSLSPYIPKVSEPSVDRRIYYQVRNRVYFERSTYTDNWSEYILNAVAYSLLQICAGLAAALVSRSVSPLSSLALFFRGMHDGLTGKRGRTY